MRARTFASRHTAEGLLIGAAAIAVVSGLIALLNQFLPLLGLTGLYLFAIVPIAIGWGFLIAGIVAFGSYLTFTYFLAPPVHSLEFADADTGTAFAVSLVIAYVVSVLAQRAQASAREAELRAEEQAALRRVATLVAADAPSDELFRAVAAEAGTLLSSDVAALLRYEPDDSVDAMAVWTADGDQPEIPVQWPIARDALAAAIATLGTRSSVGSRIVVGGRVWGALLLQSKQPGPLPADTESRLSSFTDLVATSVANAQAREEVRRLVNEQDALRRVATLVAKAVPTSEVFEAVTREVGRQCDADLARLERFEADNTVTAIAAWSREGEAQLAVGSRFTLEGASIAALVHETGRPARVDTFADAAGPIAREAQALGIRASVGCPIAVAGQTWGVIAASTTREAPFPPNTESRIAAFTELVAAAVSNAEARADLVASRTRVLTAADDARRGVVRDLHDGAQQSLVSTILALKSVEENVDEETRPLVGEALDHAERANVELRELAHGILPAVLAGGGLATAVKALVRRLRVPVTVEVPRDRFAPEIEASAYFVVAEALTNVSKHSGAKSADITAWVDDGALHVDVQDDGVGGARRDGSGLLGLADRVAALGGSMQVQSPPGGGTRITATLPLSHPPATEDPARAGPGGG